MTRGHPPRSLLATLGHRWGRVKWGPGGPGRRRGFSLRWGPFEATIPGSPSAGRRGSSAGPGRVHSSRCLLAVPALAAIVAEDPDREARIQASLALLKIGAAARAAVPQLTGALADEEPLVRMNAAMVLAKLRAEARPAVPALIKALKDDSNRT